MNNHTILVTETGSDIPPQLAEKYGIYLVPMHVSFGNQTQDDGTFPVEDICNYFAKTGQVPKTSGCTPEDFQKVFNKVRQEHPGKHILHLAYSAVTTCSYQSAIIAADGADDITSIDTKHVSAGQAAIVLRVAKLLDGDPDLSTAQALELVQQICQETRMCFLPQDLTYLRAGGRVSNVACLGGKILQIHPCIEILDGHLVATKKYRGKLERIAPALIREYTQQNQLQKGQIIFIWSTGLPDSVRSAAEQEARACGFHQITWIQTGCVITTHGGPSCFGVVGFSGVEEEPA